MLKQRVLTSLLLIPLVLLGIFYTSSTIFQIILASILLLGAWEWTNFANLKETNLRIYYILILLLLFFLAQYFSFIFFVTLGVLWWIFIASFLMSFHKDKINLKSPSAPAQSLARLSEKALILENRSAAYVEICEQRIAQNQGFFAKIVETLNRRSIILISGAFIFTSCFSALSFLRNQNEKWVFFLLLIVWLADIAAYFTGKQFGKHALAPQISPKKTWEGFFGAIVSVAIVTLISGLILFQVNTTWLISLWILTIIVTIISVVGDLFESYLKRQIGIKDSGQLLPGHGGLLDRIDSLIAAAPVFAMGVYLLTLLG